MFTRPRFYLLIVLGYCLFGCSNNSSNSSSDMANGELNESFVESGNPNNDSILHEQEIIKQKNNLIEEGWKDEKITNGLMPDCYNFIPKYNKSIDNYLELNVGGGTDIGVKLMDKSTEKCIRYVYVNTSSSYRIKNIPEGLYYLKIAYGKDWMSKIESNQCIGRFLRNPEYEVGVDVLDYNIIHEGNSYSIPYYTLSLDVISTDYVNSFNSQNISEDEFNK